MKISKILTTAIVALGATVALSGCIRETFPKESTITEDQLFSGQMDVVAQNLIKGIPRAMLAPAYGVWEHSDFGWPSVGIYHDHAAQIICTSGWTMGKNAAYNRFMLGSWGLGYGSTGWMPHHFWYSYYPQIKSCNDILNYLKDYEGLDSYNAIVRTYRAMFYLDLARLFECLPIDEELSEAYNDKVYGDIAGLTVPIVDDEMTAGDNDETLAKSNPRATREEMFTFILADLDYAEEQFSKEDYKPSSATDPTLAVVYGLKARTYLWLGGFSDGLSGELPEGNAAYQLASEYANKAIAEFGGAVMSEAEWTNVTTGFNVKASSWMWSLQHSTDTVYNNLIQSTAHMAPEASYGYCPFTHPGVGSKYYEMLPDADFRKKLMIAPDWSNWNEFKNYTQISEDEYESFAPYTFFKFRPAQGERNDYLVAGAIAIPLMRCEEMYFIDIETAYHLEGANAGLGKLMQFMNAYRTNGGFTYATQDILDLIIKHKAVEFWGEGIVMYDMKRLNMGVECNYEGSNYDSDRRFNSKGRLPFWTPAIPKGEMDVNQEITTDVNNPDPTNIVKPNQVLE